MPHFHETRPHRAQPERSPSPELTERTPEAMKTLRLTAARIQLAGLIFALVLALAISIGLTIGAFVLSFAVLENLATQGMMPVQWAWIFPVIVDGGILGASVCVMVLNKVEGSEAGKRFFNRVLWAVILISVGGNGFHAYRAAVEARQLLAQGGDLGFTPLAPVAAAVIAVISPGLVLAFSHGVGYVLKAIGDAFQAYRRLVAEIEETDGSALLPHTENTADEPLTQPGPVPASIAMPAGHHVDVAEVDAAHTDSTPARSMLQPIGAGPTSFTNAPVVAQEATIERSETVLENLACVATETAEETVSRVGEVTVVDEEAEIEQENAPEQTSAALLKFIESSMLSPEVKATARVRIANPLLPYSEVARLTQAPRTDIAERRDRRAKKSAMTAGFTVYPPTPTNGTDDAHSRVVLVSA